MGNEDIRNKNIQGLSFKDLSINEDKFSDDNYLFVNDDIEGSKFIRNIKKKLHEFYVIQSTKNNLIEFVMVFFEYMYRRIKVIMILLSVLMDILFGYFEAFKNTLSKSMFWGRGKFFNSAVKIIFVSIIFILTISYLYRKPVVTRASDVKLETISVAETDMAVMNSTVNTLIPKDRARRSTEEYIVKGGDTLSSIAASYDNLNVESILWANDMNENSYIKPGDKLLIPPSNGVLVKVASGDTIYTLAKKYSASDQAIVDFNWLDYPFTLTAGQEIFIPDGKKPKPVVQTPVYASSSYVQNQYKATQIVNGNTGNTGRFLSWPVAGGAGIITQYFSYYHTGIDIASNALPNIVAPAGGTVIFAGCSGYCPPLGSTYGGSGYAWSIQIDHGNGYTTWYAHLKNIYVKSGQSVARGEVIGQMGSTGRSTGPHVHFEVRRGVAYGTHVNPLLFSAW